MRPYDDRGERWDGTFRETGAPAAVQPIDMEAADADEPPRAVLPTVQESKNRFQVLRGAVRRTTRRTPPRGRSGGLYRNPCNQPAGYPD